MRYAGQEMLRGTSTQGPWSLLLLAFAAGCANSSESATTSSQGSLLKVRDNAGLLLTFFDRRAQMRTVDRLSKVPAEAREAVMVTDPRRHLDGDRVFVADLTTKNEDGEYRIWVEERGRWLDRVMPRTTVLKSVSSHAIARRSARRKTHPRRIVKTRRAPDTTGSPERLGYASSPDRAELPKVVMFSTSWCPSCRMAREYFRQRGIKTLELDVEKDPEAAQRMLAIQQAKGLKQGAVPLIVINGRVYQGFSRMMIENAVATINSPTVTD